MQNNLIAASGFDGVFTMDSDSNTWILADGDDKRIFIYPYNTWLVAYEYGVDTEVDVSLIPSENDALSLAWDYLKGYGITSEAIQYAEDISADYGDSNRHLRFTSCENSATCIVCGDVTITIGENGKLIGLYDNRRWCEYEQKVSCISPFKSISVAQDVGVVKWNGTAHVTSVESDYAFIEDTGYLVPVWKINAKAVSASGNEYKWAPVINAIK